MDVREKLVELLKPYVSGLACEQESGSCELIDCRSCNALYAASKLISHGVTVQDVPDTNVGEWISVKDKPKKIGTYIVCTDKGGILLAHWYGDSWGGGYASCHITHYMEKPQPPKGE